MQLWSVFVTGLVAGGASCAVVQGGLLAGMVARRQPAGTPEARSVVSRGAKSARQARKQTRRQPSPPRPTPWRHDALPVAGFLAGKLVSHTLLGALLGLLGSTFQLTFRARAVTQIIAGMIMLVLAADLLGVRAFRSLVPRPPAWLYRVVRRNAKSQAVAAPALLGFLTVAIPCGVTLSVELLAVASGSPLTGAAIMATFVLGTSPLFAVLGYAARRSASALRGQLAKLAAVAVLVVGLISINTGLVLAGSSVTLTTAASWMTGQSGAGRAGGGAIDATGPYANLGPDGKQVIVVEARSTSYTPNRIMAKAGVPTQLTLRTNGTRGCTRSFVIPSEGVEEVLPETGDTVIDLGVREPGELTYTCGMGMYRGSISFT